MNSIIQCLIQTPCFVEHFLNDDYVSDINKANPLGFGGQIASQFAALIQNVYSGNFTEFKMAMDQTSSFNVDKEFRNAVNGMSSFNGDKEHDSMLSFYKCIHEDLNKIINKPMIESLNENKRMMFNK